MTVQPPPYDDTTLFRILRILDADIKRSYVLFSSNALVVPGGGWTFTPLRAPDACIIKVSGKFAVFPTTLTISAASMSRSWTITSAEFYGQALVTKKFTETVSININTAQTVNHLLLVAEYIDV